MRRRKRSDPAREAPRPTTPSPSETARTVEQPVVPPLETEPSEQVLDELLSFFGVRHRGDEHASGARSSSIASPAPPVAPPTKPPASDAPNAPDAPDASDASDEESGGVTERETGAHARGDESAGADAPPAGSPSAEPARPGSSDATAWPAEAPRAGRSRVEPPRAIPGIDGPPITVPPAADRAGEPPSSPAPAGSGAPGAAGSPTEFGLVRAPTKRQTRRSAKEAKREERAERKRLARLAKERKKAAKRAAKQSGTKKRGKGGAAESIASLDTGESVRIIEAPEGDAAGEAAGAPASAAAPDAASAAPPISTEATGASGPAPTATDAAPASAPTPPPGASDEGDAARPTVSIGGDDELPDPVYLEHLLEEEAGEDRSTVFIDDKDPVTGSVVPIEVATGVARMEPRLRDRRIAVKRSVGRKRLKWLAIVTVVVGVIVAGLAVIGSGLFAIDRVEVEGAVYSVGPELDAIVADLEGQNVLRVDTEAIEDELRRIPWVEDARVTTDFPHGATIELRERVPILAYLGPDQQYRVLDADGRVITVLAGRPTDYLELMVDSAQAPNLAAGALAPDGYRAAATLVTALVDPLRPLVESLSVDAAGTDLRLTLHDGVEVRFGAANALQDKLVRLTVALMQTDPEKAPTEMIDVSTPDIVTR